MSELVDLVNSDGEIIERGVLRDDAMKYGELYMQIVVVVIRNSAGDLLVHQRAKTKKVNPGDIDHVCGGILSGETPEIAAIREALEEVGVAPKNLEIVRQGVNSYGRYCHLLRADSDELPSSELDSSEVAWAKYLTIEELITRRDDGTLTFVDGFFDDMHATSVPNDGATQQ